MDTPVNNLKTQSFMAGLRKLVVNPCIGGHFDTPVTPHPIFCCRKQLARQHRCAAPDRRHTSPPDSRPVAPDCSHRRAIASRPQQTLIVCRRRSPRRSSPAACSQEFRQPESALARERVPLPKSRATALAESARVDHDRLASPGGRAPPSLEHIRHRHLQPMPAATGLPGINVPYRMFTE